MQAVGLHLDKERVKFAKVHGVLTDFVIYINKRRYLTIVRGQYAVRAQGEWGGMSWATAPQAK